MTRTIVLTCILVATALKSSAQTKLEINASLTTDDGDRPPSRQGLYVSPFFGIGSNQSNTPVSSGTSRVLFQPQLERSLTKGMAVTYTIQESPTLGLMAFESSSFTDVAENMAYGSRLRYGGPVVGFRISTEKRQDLHFLILVGAGLLSQRYWFRQNGNDAQIQTKGAGFLLRPGFEVGLLRNLQPTFAGNFLVGAVLDSYTVDTKKSSPPNAKEWGGEANIGYYDLSLGLNFILR